MGNLQLQQPETAALFAAMEEYTGELPRHKRKALLTVLNDTAPAPPTRAHLDNFGAALVALEKQMRGTVEQLQELRGVVEEEPGRMMKARRERLMFALSVMKRVEPAYVMKSAAEIQAEGMMNVDPTNPQPMDPRKMDLDVEKLRATAGGILDRFMGGEGEHLICDEPITQETREQIAMAIDLLTSVPNSSAGGDVYCDHVRARACKTIVAFLDPESARVDAAWRKEGAAS